MSTKLSYMFHKTQPSNCFESAWTAVEVFEGFIYTTFMADLLLTKEEDVKANSN